MEIKSCRGEEELMGACAHTLALRSTAASRNPGATTINRSAACAIDPVQYVAQLAVQWWRNEAVCPPQSLDEVDRVGNHFCSCGQRQLASFVDQPGIS